MRASRRRIAASVLLVAGIQGCMFADVRKQQEIIATYCVLEGEVSAERSDAAPLIVVLARQTGADATRRDSWAIADHYLLEGAGRWHFRSPGGTYGVLAFQDLNRDLKHQPGEPYLRLEPERIFTCRAGESHANLALRIPAAGRPRQAEELDFSALRVRSVDEQLRISLGELTAYGVVAALLDARFADKVAEDGLWRPFDFLFKGGAGIYFLEPYDASKVPVLFVHGINGTPLNFRTLIGNLDRQRFQPWVYYYPSGGSLDAIADHLTQTMRQLQVRHGFRSFVVVAHSMGGLVSRGFILRYRATSGGAAIPLFVTISTPWGGHKAAELGVRKAPAVVRVWVDMAPGSQYQNALFYEDPAAKSAPRGLPKSTPHHMLFTFKQGSMSLGEANDGTVTVASQLLREAQRDATRLYGFDETHMGVLESAEVSALLNQLLRGPFGAPARD